MILMLQRGRFCKHKWLPRENSENNATITLLPVLTFSILFSPTGCAWFATPFIQVKIEASALSLKHQHKWLRGCGDAQHPMQWPYTRLEVLTLHPNSPCVGPIEKPPRAGASLIHGSPTLLPMSQWQTPQDICIGCMPMPQQAREGTHTILRMWF